MHHDGTRWAARAAASAACRCPESGAENILPHVQAALERARAIRLAAADADRPHPPRVA